MLNRIALLILMAISISTQTLDAKSRNIRVSAVVEAVIGDSLWMTAPMDLCISREGSLWVTDRSDPRIHLFDPAGEHVRSFGGTGQGDCEFTGRVAVEDPGGLFIYVADTDGGRVLKITRSGVCVREIRRGLEDGFSVWRPTSLAAAEGGLLYVTDPGGGSLDVIDPFDAVRPFLNAGSDGARIPLEPTTVACMGRDIYTGDRLDGTVYHLDRFGTVLNTYFSESEISSMDVARDGTLALVDEVDGDVVIAPPWGEEKISLRRHLPSGTLSAPLAVRFVQQTSLESSLTRWTIYVVDGGNAGILRIRVEIRNSSHEAFEQSSNSDGTE